MRLHIFSRTSLCLETCEVSVLILSYCLLEVSPRKPIRPVKMMTKIAFLTVFTLPLRRPCHHCFRRPCHWQAARQCCAYRLYIFQAVRAASYRGTYQDRK